jgi:amino acid transporter
MSGNCIAFAIRSLQAANIPRDEQSKGAVYGIAIGVATFACFIHAFSRRGGIWLGNFMAVIKVMILLVVIGAGFASIGNAFKTDPSPENLEPKNAFADAPDDAYGYAQAFLAVLFAYNGYEQPCYVSSPCSLFSPFEKYCLTSNFKGTG